MKKTILQITLIIGAAGLIFLGLLGYAKYSAAKEELAAFNDLRGSLTTSSELVQQSTADRSVPQKIQSDPEKLHIWNTQAIRINQQCDHMVKLLDAQIADMKVVDGDPGDGSAYEHSHDIEANRSYWTTKSAGNGPSQGDFLQQQLLNYQDWNKQFCIDLDPSGDFVGVAIPPIATEEASWVETELASKPPIAAMAMLEAWKLSIEYSRQDLFSAMEASLAEE